MWSSIGRPTAAVHVARAEGCLAGHALPPLVEAADHNALVIEMGLKFKSAREDTVTKIKPKREVTDGRTLSVPI